MAIIFALAILIGLFVLANSFVGLFQLDPVMFWKNSESAAKAVVEELQKKEPIKISQAEVFKRLNSEAASISEQESLEKFKKTLKGDVVEWTLRVDQVRKFGNRYQVVSQNEAPVSSESEELGKIFAKKLMGSKNKGTALSICGTTYVYAGAGEGAASLEKLSEGNLVRVKGVVQDYTWTADPFGVGAAFANIFGILMERKDRLEGQNCVKIGRAVVSTNQDNIESSKLGADTLDTLKKIDAIKDGFESGISGGLAQ